MFEELSEEIFLKVLELNPQQGSGLGLHEYDGRVGDISLKGIENEKKVYRDFLKKLSDTDREKLSSGNKLSYDIAVWGLESALFDYEVIQSYRKNPMNYAFMFSDIHNYISRDYAPFEERLKSVINIIDKIPVSLKTAVDILDREIPAVLCKYAKQFSLGYEDFFKGELLEEIKSKVKDESLIADYLKKSESAVDAFQGFVEFLDTASSETNESYRLGKEVFCRMLKVKEHIDISAEELKSKGLLELERLQNEMKSVLKENNFEGKLETLEHSHPDEHSLVSETNDTLNELIEFIRNNRIVDMPDRLNCIVTEMPKYMNFGFAAMGTAGPFEKSDESFYYVNLPDTAWSAEKKEEWMTQFNYPTLKLISIHEAYPGHYVHFLNANRNSSKLAKLFMSYSYVEGWAHYTEEMMIDEGYGKGDFKMKIGQLIEALIRCCRYIAAIDIHCENKSINEVKDFFVKNAFMTETTAMQEAERGAFDPGYLNYTLGKIYLKEFRRRYFSKFSKNKSLMDFHNTIVSLGAPTFDIAGKHVFGGV